MRNTLKNIFVLFLLGFVLSPTQVDAQKSITIQCYNCEELSKKDCDFCETRFVTRQYLDGLVVRYDDRPAVPLKKPIEVWTSGRTVYMKDKDERTVGVDVRKTPYNSVNNLVAKIFECSKESEVIAYNLDLVNDTLIRLIGSDGTIEQVNIKPAIQQCIPDETITFLTGDSDSIYYMNELGDVVSIPLPQETITTLAGDADSVYYTNEAGTVVGIPFPDETVTNLTNDADSFYYTNESGLTVSVPINNEVQCIDSFWTTAFVDNLDTVGVFMNHRGIDCAVSIDTVKFCCRDTLGELSLQNYAVDSSSFTLRHTNSSGDFQDVLIPLPASGGGGTPNDFDLTVLDHHGDTLQLMGGSTLLLDRDLWIQDLTDPEGEINRSISVSSLDSDDTELAGVTNHHLVFSLGSRLGSITAGSTRSGMVATTGSSIDNTDNALVAAGRSNTIASGLHSSAIISGQDNLIDGGVWNGIFASRNATVSASSSGVAFGTTVDITAPRSASVGGQNILITDNNNTALGGIDNQILNGEYGIASGGQGNIIDAPGTVNQIISGGTLGQITSNRSHNALVGGGTNLVGGNALRSGIFVGNTNQILGGADIGIVAASNTTINTTESNVFSSAGVNNQIIGDAAAAFIIGGNNNLVDAAPPTNSIGGIIASSNSSMFSLGGSALIAADNSVLNVGVESSIIAGGLNHTMDAIQSGIYAGNGNTMSATSLRSAIIGGFGYTTPVGTTDMVYVPSLTMWTVPDYATDAAADADILLPSGGVYVITGQRDLKAKP